MSLFIIIILMFTAHSDEDVDSEIIEGSNKFGYDLSDNLYVDVTTNIWISPFCITSCFALIYPGSNGDTQSQIGDVMGYPSCSTNDQCSDITQQYFNLQLLIENTYNGSRKHWEYGSIIGIANKIYSSNALQLKQSYIDILQLNNDDLIDYNFDFTASNATQIINEWVYDNTNGLIDSILSVDQVIDDWMFVALNAIYLNGTFSLSFKSSMTSLQTFYSDISRTKHVTDCHLMHQKEYFAYYDDGNYQFIKMTFDDWSKGLFVLFALPKSSTNGVITDKEYIKTAITHLQTKYIAFAIPKISIEVKYELENGILPNMGIIDAFDESKADFSGISEINLKIDTVIHKTMIEMDESGLVAAAVTLISMIPLSGEISHPNPILFKADHPFEMFIVDAEHDNLILFMGHIGNPGIPQNSETPTYSESDDPVWDGAVSPFLLVSSVISILFLLF